MNEKHRVIIKIDGNVDTTTYTFLMYVLVNYFWIRRACYAIYLYEQCLKNQKCIHFNEKKLSIFDISISFFIQKLNLRS